MATDIHTLNAALGAAIEQQVAESLNSLRRLWDPDDRYRLCRFVRQSQTFPDVLLQTFDPATSRSKPLMGIELKGWYLLAKEGEPSFRYTVTPAVCAPQDLVVVVPWVLSNVISGSPRVFDPYVESARYAAEYRNYHWQHIRKAKSDPKIRLAAARTSYPAKSDAISDKPTSDSGGNFGRLARSGIMDEYMAAALRQPLCGIEARHWRAFFRIFQDSPQSADQLDKIDALRTQLEQRLTDDDSSVLAELHRILDAVSVILASL